MPELLVFELRRVKQQSTDFVTNLEAGKSTRFYTDTAGYIGSNPTVVGIRNYLGSRIQEQVAMLVDCKKAQETLGSMNKSHSSTFTTICQRVSGLGRRNGRNGETYSNKRARSVNRSVEPI